jgi:hypothetical protein
MPAQKLTMTQGKQDPTMHPNTKLQDATNNMRAFQIKFEEPAGVLTSWSNFLCACRDPGLDRERKKVNKLPIKMALWT